MYLLVGLGNPDAKYAGNRHNAGFMVLDAIADSFGPVRWSSKFSGQFAEVFVDIDQGRAKVLLLKPATYYNESGRSVRAALDFYKLSSKQVCVFHDELALAPGKFRIKLGGGSAGNNGIKSVASTLGSDFWRARIGIGHPGDKTKVTGFVLKDFSKSEQNWFEQLKAAIIRALPLLITGKIDAFQTKTTHLAPAPEVKEAK